jgi:hypothetical protein
MEDVHDEVDVVEQRPAALLEPLGVVHRQPGLLQLEHHVLRYRAHVRVRAAAGDDEEVGHVGDALEVEQDDVAGLEVERQQGGAARRLGGQDGGSGGVWRHRVWLGRGRAPRGHRDTSP